MFISQFSKQFVVLWITDIYFLTIFNKVSGLRFCCLSIRIGNKKEKAEYQENYKISK